MSARPGRTGLRTGSTTRPPRGTTPARRRTTRVAGRSAAPSSSRSGTGDRGRPPAPPGRTGRGGRRGDRPPGAGAPEASGPREGVHAPEPAGAAYIRSLRATGDSGSVSLSRGRVVFGGDSRAPRPRATTPPLGP